MSFLEPEEGQTMTSKDVIHINELKQIGSYVLTKTLGKGSYAVVKLGVHEETNEKVAVKIIRKSSYLSPSPTKSMKQADRILREVAILKMIRHPGVVQLLDFIETMQFYVLIMEYVPGKTLYRHLRKSIQLGQEPGGIGGSGLSTEQIFRMFYQLVSSLDYCHSMGIAHRDIKPENVLMDEDTLKLTDFGLANLIRPDELMDTHCGSPYYAPPEIMRGEKYKGSAADVWSLGVVLFVMVVGRLPFLDESLSAVMRLICDAKYEIPSHVDLHLQDLMERMLHPVYTLRISLRQLKNHPWWLKHCMLFDLNPAGTPVPNAMPLSAVKAPPPIVRPDGAFPASATAPVLDSLPSTQLRAAVRANPIFRRRFFSSTVGPSAGGDQTAVTRTSNHSINGTSGSESLSFVSPDRSIGTISPRSPLSDGTMTASSGEGKNPKTFPNSKGRFASRMRSMVRILRDKLCGKAYETGSVYPFSQ